MAKQDNLIRLLLVEDSAEDAEQVVSQLRNAGIAVRPHRAETREELTRTLAEQDIDLVLVNVRARTVPLPDVVAVVEQSGKDLPVIALVPSINDDLALDLLRERVRAFALRSRPEHLQAVVRREAKDRNDRRALRRLEASLKESERRCEALLDSSRDPIVFVHEGMHVRANRAYLEMFGYSDFEEIEGTPILDLIAGPGAEGFKNLLKKLSKGEKPTVALDVSMRRADGEVLAVMMEFAEATFEGEPCQQITLRRPQAAGGPPPDVDLVTGLANRQHFLKALDGAVAEAAAGRSDLALAYIEPDNYRSVLESIGIGNADLLMSDAAELLRQKLPEEALAARFSDNTFMLLLRGVPHDEAARFTAALRKRFDEHIFEVGGRSLPLPVSIGLVMIGEKNASAAVVLASAAQALKQAQLEGGNRICTHDPAAQEKANAAADRERLALIQDALKNNKFVLFFQPIISLHGAEGEYYEILLRLNGPVGEILPGEFLPTAERAGLLPAIDRWVVATAFKQLAERIRDGHRTTFFVKLTPQSVEDPALLSWIAQHLKLNRLAGEYVVFEMPESKITTNLRPVREFLKGLQQLHCGFAVQQFGSGLNSFQLLKHIDAKYLKIDRTFMADLARSRENQARVKQICDQAHSHGKITIAEFVEDAASMSILFGFGINFVQGNFLQEAEKVMRYDFG